MANKIDTSTTENVPANIRGEDQLGALPIHRAESEAALDDLLKQSGTDETKPDETKPDETKPDETEPDETKPDETKPDETKPDETKPDETKPDETKPDETEPKKDKFDAVELPPHIKPKTTEAFDKVKALAREEISTLQKTVQELTDKTKTIEQEKQQAVEKLQRENEELQQWKRSVDVESDPTFKEFDSKQQKNVDNILAKLTEAGFAAEDVAQIKQHGAKIVWDDVWKFFETNTDAAAKLKIPVSTLRRYVEAKLIDNESLSDSKREALEAAKKNAKEFLDKRTAKQTEETKQAEQIIVSRTQELLGQFPWSSETKIPEGASAEQKQQLEAQNKFSKEQQARIQEMLKNRKPEDVAEYIAGTAIAHYYLASSKHFEKQLKDTTDKLKAAEDELARIKKSSGANRTQNNALRQSTSTTKEDLFVPASDALDKLRDDVLGARV